MEARRASVVVVQQVGTLEDEPSCACVRGRPQGKGYTGRGRGKWSW